MNRCTIQGVVKTCECENISAKCPDADIINGKCIYWDTLGLKEKLSGVKPSPTPALRPCIDCWDTRSKELSAELATCHEAMTEAIGVLKLHGLRRDAEKLEEAMK